MRLMTKQTLEWQCTDALLDVFKRFYNEAIEQKYDVMEPPAATCFPASTRVLTHSGYRPIADIEKGDLVLTYGPDGSTQLRPVTRKLTHGETSILSVCFEEGPALRTTGFHTVLTARGWLRVDALVVGDSLIQHDGTQRVVQKLMAESKREPVYNLYTAGEHTFIVEGCVAHNFTVLRTLRTWLHRVFIDPFWLQSPRQIQMGGEHV